MSYEGDLVATYATIHKRLLNSHRSDKIHPPLVPHFQSDKNSQAALLLRIEALEEAIKRINRFLIEGERVSDKGYPHYPQMKTLPVEKIIQIVIEMEGITRAEVESRQRRANLVTVRHMIFYLCSRWTMRSLGEIGRRVGVQDHTTVMHGIRKMMLKRSVDADIDIKLSRYEEKLRELVNIGDASPSSVESVKT